MKKHFLTSFTSLIFTMTTGIAYASSHDMFYQAVLESTLESYGHSFIHPTNETHSIQQTSYTNSVGESSVHVNSEASSSSSSLEPVEEDEDDGMRSRVADWLDRNPHYAWTFVLQEGARENIRESWVIDSNLQFASLRLSKNKKPKISDIKDAKLIIQSLKRNFGIDAELCTKTWTLIIPHPLTEARIVEKFKKFLLCAEILMSKLEENPELTAALSKSEGKKKQR